MFYTDQIMICCILPLLGLVRRSLQQNNNTSAAPSPPVEVGVYCSSRPLAITALIGVGHYCSNPTPRNSTTSESTNASFCISRANACRTFSRICSCGCGGADGGRGKLPGRPNGDVPAAVAGNALCTGPGTCGDFSAGSVLVGGNVNPALQQYIHREMRCTTKKGK